MPQGYVDMDTASHMDFEKFVGTDTDMVLKPR